MATFASGLRLVLLSQLLTLGFATSVPAQQNDQNAAEQNDQNADERNGQNAAERNGQNAVQQKDVTAQRQLDLVADPLAIEQIEMVMFDEPKLTVPRTQFEVPNAPIPLWQKALARNDAELQRVTVDTIAAAHRQGMQGLEQFVPRLLKLAKQADLTPQLRRSVAATLIELEVSGESELLAELAARHGPLVSAVVEPALTRWQSKAMAERWLQRLEDPTADRLALIYAVEGLAALEDKRATEPLSRLLFDKTGSVKIRMLAARALGLLHTEGMEQRAEQLVEEAAESMAAGLYATALMQRHDSDQAVDLLRRLAVHQSTAVQANALGRLFDIDPALVSPFASDAIISPDVNVRRVGAKAMFAERDAEQIEPLSRLLSDVHPGLRHEVAAALVVLATEHGLREPVIESSSAVLGRDDWRGCEQATIVLVNLDHKPAGARMVELLTHPRGEVMASSGWGLRRLALPEHLPAMLEQAKANLRALKSGEQLDAPIGIDRQNAQLFMAFGQLDYVQADEVLRPYIPKNYAMGQYGRPAAVWALGYLHQDQAPESLAAQLVERLEDTDAVVPEQEWVRRMSAISLARMDAESALPSLRRFVNGMDTAGSACRWAVERMTGEQVPVPAGHRRSFGTWFLEPVAAAEQ